MSYEAPYRNCIGWTSRTETFRRTGCCPLSPFCGSSSRVISTTEKAPGLVQVSPRLRELAHVERLFGLELDLFSHETIARFLVACDDNVRD